MVSLRDAAKALATITDKALKKESRGEAYSEIYSLIHDLYRKGGYVPVSRIGDLKYSAYLLRILTSQEESRQVGIMLEWAKSRGIEANTSNPFDLVRVILDTLFEVCLYGSTKEKDLLSMEVLRKKALTLTYKGFCSLIKGLSEFAATQLSKDYLFHLGDLFKELFTSYTGIEIKSLTDALRANPEKFEAFRVHITAKFFPTVKAYLTILYLFKHKWSIMEILSLKKAESGLLARKVVDPTYLGRITSELLDSMMGVYYDDTALHAYDAIVKAYFSVFQDFSNDIERKNEIGYIESHPIMPKYVSEVESVFRETTPQIRSHLERRGIVRLGEVKQDVKDYLLTLFYLNKEGDQRGYVPISEIGNYNLDALLTRNSLEKGETSW